MIRVCSKGHLTGYRSCPMCGDAPRSRRPLPAPLVTPHDHASRQQRRAATFAKQYGSNAVKGTDRGTRKYPIPSRSDRRKEARAFARGELRKSREAVA